MKATSQKNTTPTKVTMTITKRGWTVKVYAGKTVLSDRPWNRNLDGHFLRPKPGSVYDDLGRKFADLAQAIDNDLSHADWVSGELHKLSGEGL